MELTAVGLTKAYGAKRALDGVSGRIGPGITALLGPNGSGKTTLLRILATAARPDSGQVAWADRGRSLDLRSVRRTLGYLPQTLELPGHMTPLGLVRYLAQLKGLTPGDELEALGLGDLAGRPLEQLSGGQVRRAGLAQALLGAPRLLVLDEPTAGLDPQERDRVLQMLRRPVPGRVVLLSSHVPSEVEAVAADVILLHEGRVRFSGPVDDLRETARGQTWDVTAPAAQVEALLGGCRVSRVAVRGDTAQLRVVGAPPAGLPAEPAEPSLEDAYLLLVGTAPAGAASK